MKLRIKNIIMLNLILSCLLSAQGDMPFDTSLISGLEDNPENLILLNCVPVIDNIPLTISDYICVYNGEDSLVGVTQYRPEDTNYILSYAGNRLDSGWNSNFIYKVYRQNGSPCIIDVEVVENNFIAANIDTIDSINPTITKFEANTPVIGYDSIVCSSEKVIGPMIEGYIMDEISFVSDKSIQIDSVGQIYPSKSVPGIHQIYIKSDYCIRKNSFEINIVEPQSNINTSSVQLCDSSALHTQLNANIDYNTLLELNSNWDNSNKLIDKTYSFIEIDSNNCRINKTIDVTYVLPQPINISYEYLCDSTLVSIENLIRSSSVKWSNGGTQISTKIPENTSLNVEVYDQYGCISSKDIEVEVRKFEIKDIDYNVEERSCWEFGKITVESSEAINGETPYSYTIKNTLNNQVLDDFNKVPEGIYTIAIRDARECKAVYSKKITIMQECMNNFPVFAPNEPNGEDSYFIPYNGFVEIYDRKGHLLNKLETPAYWYGKDMNGNNVPMGNYVMITGEGKVVNVTVIR